MTDTYPATARRITGAGHRHGRGARGRGPHRPAGHRADDERGGSRGGDGQRGDLTDRADPAPGQGSLQLVALRAPPHEHRTQHLLHMTSIWENPDRPVALRHFGPGARIARTQEQSPRPVRLKDLVVRARVPARDGGRRSRPRR